MKSTPIAFGIAAVSMLGLGAFGGGNQQPTSGESPHVKLAKTPTYAEDIAPILNTSCVSCHRPGEVAPFSLIGFENAKKWSGMNANVATRGIMPPWKAVAGYNQFHDENRLTPVQIAMLDAWHKAGAPRGDVGKEPPTPKFPDTGWSLGTPDLVLTTNEPFKLDPETKDLYRNFIVLNDNKETLWVRAMEVKPGNPRVVHHVIAYLDSRGNAVRLAENTKDGREGYIGNGGGPGFLPSGSLGGWAPGTNSRFTPEGTAFKINPGETVVMQVHYNGTGKPEEDQTKLGLYLEKGSVEQEMRLNWLLNLMINIPAGENAYKSRQEFRWPVDVTLHAAMPHMHLLGKSMKSWLELPDGTVKPLIHVDDWDFNWQFTYAFKEPVRAPAGSKQITEAIYDNSEDNPRNPNSPPKRVRFGEGTADEMFLLIMAYTVDKK
jgi:hypothetical protein